MGRAFLSGVLLTIILAAMWALMSGYGLKQPLVTFGAIGVAVAVAMTVRMGILDEEGAPFPRLLPFLRYWIWLGEEILKANIYVLRTVLKPDLDITPTLTRVPVRAKTGLARATFANSITLTPGTVTVEVEDGGFLVHALTRELADQEAFAEIERRVMNAAGETGAA